MKGVSMLDYEDQNNQMMVGLDSMTIGRIRL